MVDRKWTYLRYRKMHEEWGKSPPLRWFAVAYFGYKRPVKPSPVNIPAYREQQQQVRAPQQEQEVPSNVVGLMDWLKNQPDKAYSG